LKVKQHTLLSFEFTIGDSSFESFSSYLEKNRELLKNHLIVFKETPSVEVEELLSSESICYINRENCSINMRKKRVTPFEIDVDSIKPTASDSEEEQSSKQLGVLSSGSSNAFHRPIRSGELIETEGDVTVLSRMNSGSEISAGGNVQIFGIIEGKVECNGSYMIVSRIGEKGNVIFNGIILEKSRFMSKQPKLIKLSTDGKLSIEELA
jgi:septum site-determining protein MinC